MLLKLIQHDGKRISRCRAIFTSSVEFDISIVYYSTAWNSLKHLKEKIKINSRDKHSILNKTIMFTGFFLQ